MSDLSEEQKRRIRAEEEERVKNIQAEEEYRQQVRRELNAEEDYRKQVREELKAKEDYNKQLGDDMFGSPVSPPPVEPALVQPPPAQKIVHPRPAAVRKPKQPKPAKKKAKQPRASRKLRIGFGTGMLLVGVALAYYGYSEGFPLPGIDGPFCSEFVAATPLNEIEGKGPNWTAFGSRSTDLLEAIETNNSHALPTSSTTSTTATPPSTTKTSNSTSTSSVPVKTVPRSDKSNTSDTGEIKDLPVGWNLAVSNPDLLKFVPTSAGEEVYVAVYPLNVDWSSFDEAFEYYSEWVMEDIADADMLDASSTIEDLLPNASRAAGIQIDFTFDSFDLQRLLIVAENGGRYVVFVCSASANDWESHVPAFREIVEGYKF